MEFFTEIKLRDEEDEAKNEIWKYVFGYVNLAVVKCAVELGVADVIQNHKTPISLTRLSSILKSSPHHLSRIMRLLVNQNIFKQEFIDEHTIGYSQTPLSRFLLRNGDKSLAPFILFESDPTMLAPWHNLSTFVLSTGDNDYEPFEATHGKDIYSYGAANPWFSKLFNEAMACEAKMTASTIVENCPHVFEGLESLVDVGGGTGTTLRILVKSFPFIKGINFDLPHVISVAPKWDGVENVEGNMFEYIPKADAVFIKVHAASLIHDDLPCMDDDPIRRGQPSNHTIYGVDMAILAGDALFPLGFQHIVSNTPTDLVPETRILRVITEIARAVGSTGMAAGQFLDLEGGTNSIEFVQEKKFGEMGECSAVCGGLLAGADDDEIEKLRKYGRAVGILYQVIDDVLEEKSTKVDGIEKKKKRRKSYVGLYGVEKAMEVAEELRSQAKKELDGFEKYGENVLPLYSFVDYAADRGFDVGR